MPSPKRPSGTPAPRSILRARRTAVTAAGLVLGLLFAQPGRAAERPVPSGEHNVAAPAAPSAAATEIIARVRATADNQGMPFLVIDKVGAQVLVFDREGRLLGIAPVLLGLGRGDVSPPGIGDRPLSTITPAERITPAGRFMASLGENLGGKRVLWIDYEAALSLHPVITTRPADRRLERLATATPEDNRISYGCVNVPTRFFEDIVQPAFNGTVGVVYILPESRSLQEVFVLPRGAVRSAADHGGPPSG